MPDHRDGPRLINALFPVFEKLPPRQQALFIELMGAGSKESGFAQGGLAEEIEEAKAHFRTKLASIRPPAR